MAGANNELSKVFEPKSVQDKIYKMWEDSGCFTGVIDSEKMPYTIVIPPPNVTGQLHLGHAFDNTIQDILIRYKRMQGYAALWVPGTDHAGIATQARVEEELRKEGLTRFDLGREKFLMRVWDWKNQYGSRIIEQLKRLGSSCDWTRERFTMDEGCSKAVREVFVSLYEKGLIYKGKRIINWCPKCTTALSDAEVSHEEKDGKLYHIKYYVKKRTSSTVDITQSNDREAQGEVLSDSSHNSGADFIVVATTRPETMLGDTGIAVHPDDKRYSHLVGGFAVLPLLGRQIPIVADEYVDMEFGTGCVKVTPSHDPNDFDIGERHNLEHILIMDDSACIINSDKYNNLDRYEARTKIIEDLQSGGLLIETRDHKMNIGICYRCNTVVEPIASEQWFVKMKPLAEPAITAVKDGEIKFVPERFSKIYIHWMENVRDWCISRQLWWGHQIPAWYCRCGHVTVSREDPLQCERCASLSITRDEDVLDTWFSSALWPFSTLGWPEKTPDFNYFYPTNVLSCGVDIIFFWVARMIFSGIEFTGKKPFHTVCIHGMIRDDQGRIMSKSLGNGVDPIDVIDKYGADALRFNIITGNSPGNDMRFYAEKCEAMRNFANKIWNASRFVMMNLSSSASDKDSHDTGIDKQVAGENEQLTSKNVRSGKLPDKLELEDKWILSKLNTLASEVNDNIDKYELGIAAAKIYDFIWDSYCDWYIELTKPRLQEGGEQSINAQSVLVYVLKEILTILHPFMPFITEEIYQTLLLRETDGTTGIDDKADEVVYKTTSHDESKAKSGESQKLLMVRKYTEYTDSLHFPIEEAQFESIMAVVHAVRARRAEMNVPPSKKAALTISTEKSDIFEAGKKYIARLAFASEVTIVKNDDEMCKAEKLGSSHEKGATDDKHLESGSTVTIVTDDARLFLPLAELVDLAAEKERVDKEIIKVTSEIGKLKQKLSNEQFISKAPESVVNTERQRLEKAEALLRNLEESLSSLE